LWIGFFDFVICFPVIQKSVTEMQLVGVAVCIRYHYMHLFAVLQCLETFWTNPQYRTTVTDPDDDDDENMGTLLIALMQKERRKKRKEGLDMLTIGYAVYKVSYFHLLFNRPGYSPGE